MEMVGFQPTKRLTKQLGFTLLEVLVAMSVAVVILTAMVISVLSSLDSAESGGTENLAAKYATQGIEVVRQIRDTDYATFKNLSGTYCLDKDSTTLRVKNITCALGGSIGNVDNLIREVNIDPTGPNQCTNNGKTAIMATVTVFWEDSKCSVTSPFCHNVKLVSCFSDTGIVTKP